MKLFVELADTPARREMGLMHRKSLGQNEGMLFKFPHKDVLSFWMKNTNMPLDIAFISDDGVILQIFTMTPMSTRTTSSSEKCRYALEVNKDWFNSNGVSVGAKLKGLYFNGKKAITAQAQVNQQTQQNAKDIPNQEVIITLGNKEKIKYASEHGLKMRILYITKDGFYVGPRILSAVPQENYIYPFLSGPLGEIFKGYDESPTITGNGPPKWESRGGTPKSFYIDFIQKLEILDNNSKTINMVRGMPVVEDEEDVKIDENVARKTIKKAIPDLNDDQWNKMKKDVIGSMKKGFSLSDIIDNVKTYFMSFFNLFRKKK